MTKLQGPIPSDAEFYRFEPDSEEVYFQGKRVTDEVVGRLVDHAERTGPPIDTEDPRYAGLIPGGKSLSGDGRHSPSITVVLPREIRDRVKETAASEGMSMSKWLRQLIERNVA